MSIQTSPNIRSSEPLRTSRRLLPTTAFPPPCSRRAMLAVAELEVVRTLRTLFAMNTPGTLILVASAAFLMACTSSSRLAASSERPELNRGISQPQIATLRARLARLRFPQPKGTVERLLPLHARLVSITIGDRFHNDAGLLAVYHYRYALSPDWELILRQGHYAALFGTKVRDDGAQIIRRQN